MFSVINIAMSIWGDELTRPSLWSAMVQESIKVWAMTDSTASTWSEVCTSKMSCGFLRILIQNRSGKLKNQHAWVSRGLLIVTIPITEHFNGADTLTKLICFEKFSFFQQIHYYYIHLHKPQTVINSMLFVIYILKLCHVTIVTWMAIQKNLKICS